MKQHIEEYFDDKEDKGEISKELFSGEKKDIDFKSELNNEELIIIAIMRQNDEFLKNVGLKEIYENYTQDFMKLKVSLERKSRGEFVDINAIKYKDMYGRSGGFLNKMFENINDVKK